MKSEIATLSERLIGSLEAKPKAYVLHDKAGSLRLRVQPSGSKSYFVEGRCGGKPTKITIGSTKFVTLADAREEAERLRSKIAIGERPKSRSEIAREHEAAVEAKRKAETPIEQLVAIYLEERRVGKLRAWRNLHQRERDILRTVKPWHGRPAGEITYDDIRVLIGGFTSRGEHRSAVSAVRDLQGLFAWLAHERRIAVSPFAGMKSTFLLGGAADLKARERVLDDAELRIVWNAASKVDAPYGTILRLLILLGLRRNEIAGLRWGELDLPNHRITLPPERTKTKIKHTVPLTGLAFDLVRSIPKPKLAEPGDRVFHTKQGYEISGLDHMKRKLDAVIAKAGHEVAPWVVHDLRRSMRSGLSRLVDEHGERLISFEIAETLIGHRTGNAISRTYDKTLPWKAMTRAAELWSAHVAMVIGENVVKLPRPKAKRRAVEA
jgi:integrase